ncbi:MAG: Transcriptional regulator, partial [Enterobacter kobei]|nr:Transcriptional regulator [Enterobacter kobei]
YPKIALDVRVKRTPYILDMLENNEVDLAVSTYRPAPFESLTLRRSPTHWYCAAEYVLQKGDPLPLVLLEEPSALRDTVIHTLNAADIPWRMAYVASTLAAVKAAVKAGLGITARPVEMMSPDLRVLGQFDGLPPLADTEYVLCHNAQAENELAQVVFQAMENYHTPWQYSTVTPHEGGDPLIVEHDAE